MKNNLKNALFITLAMASIPTFGMIVDTRQPETTLEDEIQENRINALAQSVERPKTGFQTRNR